MILVDLPARITCDEKDCQAKTPAQLCLKVDGTFAFRPPITSAWQVGASQNGTFVTLCSQHAKQIVAPPVIQTLALRNDH